jgi:hypothetical protein
MEQILAVMAVFALLGGSLWWMKKRGIAAISGFSRLPQRRSGGTMESLERLPLTATHVLHLVRVADRAILIASSPAGCQVVETSPWPLAEDRR